MPGIVGVVPYDSDSLLERMISSIRYEDWYQINKYSDSFFGIARVHLGIFNPEQQPIFNDDKTLCIFMEGKIYDYEKEMNELKRKGQRFNIKNDAEFCLHLYEEYEKDFVKKLNGNFIIVIYDFKEKKLLIVNDRYGLRPIYYAQNNDRLLFASEVKAILQDKTFKREINDEAVADFFAFGEILGNKTLFKNIEALTFASIFTYKDGKVSIEQYWDFKYAEDYDLSEEDFTDQLVKNFKKAVEIRMEDNHRYGIALSGGLDSRSIVGAIDKKRRQDITTFTFGPSECDEVKIAKQVAHKAGTKHKVIEITPELIIDNAKDEIYFTDGMDYIGVSYIPPVHKIISKDIDVVFDGFILGYTLGGDYLTKDIINAKNDEELFSKLYRDGRFFSDEELKKVLVDKYYDKIKDYPLTTFREIFNCIKIKDNPGNKADRFFIQHFMRFNSQGHVLMRTSVENSSPTFDNELIDVILKIPPELRLNHRIYRKFLKKLSPELAKIPYQRTMIPADASLTLWKAGKTYLGIKRRIKRLIWTASKGMIFLPDKRSYVNFDEWLRRNENWKKKIRDLLLDENALSKTYFNQEYIKNLIREHEDWKGKNSQKILCLASFELFLKLFMNKDVNERALLEGT